MIIQAIGLVGYTIIYKNEVVKTDSEILEELNRCAKILAALDYAKNAVHWDRCRVMQKKGMATLMLHREEVVLESDLQNIFAHSLDITLCIRGKYVGTRRSYFKSNKKSS